MKVRAVAAIIVLCLAALTAGCWDSREPNDLVYGMAIGFDIDDDGQYIAMIQFANPSAASQAPGSSGRATGSGSYSFWTFSARGHTPAEAVASLQPFVARDVALTHAEVLLISERLARQGIGPIIDYIARSWQTRLLIASAVVDGDVMQLLRAESPVDPIPALSIRRMLDLVRASEMAPSSSDLLSAVNCLLRIGSDLIMPVLKVHDEPSGGSKTVAGPPEQAPFSHSGAAVFRGDKMVGYINSKEARGAGFALDEAGSTALHVESPRGGILSIKVVDVKTDVTPSYKDGKISFVVKASANGYIEGETGPSTPPVVVSDNEFDVHVRARMAQVIREDIEAAFSKSAEYGSDFLELGNVVYRKLPRAWKSGVGDRWYDILPQVELRIEVDAELSQPGLLREKPLRVSGL